MSVIIVKASSSDGHVRMTRGERFLVAGGDQETHEQMQDTAMKFQELTEGTDTLTNEQFVEVIRKSGIAEMGQIVSIEVAGQS
ncbi:MAG: hypothetical protein Q8K86_08345 [Candidatus Nanopelagicaceae bacterium]|nr:hypothetical protein [Candidatus Nanopelagicaceae bacterium]